MATNTPQKQGKESGLDFIIRKAAPKFPENKVRDFHTAWSKSLRRHMSMTDRLNEEEIEWLTAFITWKNWSILGSVEAFTVKRPTNPSLQAKVPSGFLPLCQRCKNDGRDCPMVFEAKCNRFNTHHPYKVRYGFENFNGTACPECFRMERLAEIEGKLTEIEDAAGKVAIEEKSGKKSVEDSVKIKKPVARIQLKFNQPAKPKEPAKSKESDKTMESDMVKEAVEIKETDNANKKMVDQVRKNENFFKWLKFAKSFNPAAKDVEPEAAEIKLFAEGYQSESFDRWIDTVKKTTYGKGEMELKGVHTAIHTGSAIQPKQDVLMMVAPKYMPDEAIVEKKVEVEKISSNWFKVKKIRHINEDVKVVEDDDDWALAEDTEEWDFV